MRTLLAVIASLSLLHCSSSPAHGGSNTTSSSGAAASGTASTSAGASSGTATGSSGSSTASSSGASSSSSGGTPDAGPLHGAVFFVSANLPTGAQHAIAAGFVDASSPIPNDPSACTDGTVVGSCCYHGQLPAASSSSSSSSGSVASSSSGSASSSSSSSGGAVSTTQYSAGIITTTDGATTLATLTPSSAGAYTPNTMATWMVGDSLMATAAGDTVPAFTGTVMASTALTITAPATPASPLMPTQVSTSAAYVVSWDGAGGEEIYTQIYTVAGGFTPVITCTSMSGNNVTIPSAFMAALPTTGPINNVGAIAVLRANTVDASVGNATITVYALTGDGVEVQFTP